MSPLLIVAIAPLGVAALVGLVYLLGGSGQTGFATGGEALARFRNDFPDWKGDDVILSDDGQIALIPSAQGGKVGLVFSVGDVFVTRLLQPGDIDRADSDGTTSRIHFHDFAAPDLQVPRSLIAQLDARLAA